jgi:hypothetical protein
MASNPFQSSDSGGGYALPKNIRYSGVLPVGVPASSITKSFNPQNGDKFTDTGTNTIRIPISANSFLSPSESYLKFTVTNSSATDIWQLQSSAYSFFSQLRVETSDGQEIDRIASLGPLMAFLSDAQLPLSFRQSVGSVSMGYSTKSMVSSQSMKGVAADLSVQSYEDNVGNCAIVLPGESRTFCMPLIGLFGQDKYLPLSKIRGSGLVIELTLAKPNDAVVSATAAGDVDWSISGVEYVGRLVNFDGAFMQSFDQVMAVGGVQISTPTYLNFVSNQEAGSYVMPISARNRSIKSIFALQRLVSTVTENDRTVNRTDARVYDGIESYQFQIGPTYYPQKAVKINGDGTEAYCELYKALGMALNNTGHPGTLINIDNYTAADYTARSDAVAHGVPGTFDPDTQAEQPLKLGCFAIGIDLEAFAPGSGLENGINTLDNSLPLNMIVNRNGSGAIRVDAYCLVDQIVQLNPDGSLTVSR